jgi:hypothetical protein
MEEYEYIKGYENLYKICKGGKIFSCHQQKEMKAQTTSDNYYYVNLKKDGKKYKSRIHRLLAKQYINNPDNKPEVDHIDRNKQNNDLTNLRWVSRIENRNNRDDIIANLSEENKLARLDKIKQYKREWAEKNRREKGVKLRSEMTLTKDPNYKNNKAKEYKAKLTDEQKEAKLEARRLKYAENNIIDKQREYVNRPEVKERRRLQQIERRKKVKEITLDE